MAVSKGMVRKIRMAPGKENTKILILFNEELQIWDKNAVRTTLVYIPYRMKIYTEFNLATWLRSLKFPKLNIGES